MRIFGRSLCWSPAGVVILDLVLVLVLGTLPRLILMLALYADLKAVDYTD